MQTTTAYRRARPGERDRRAHRGDQRGDAIAAALTAQVLLCALLLLAALLAKKIDPPRYDNVKRGYTLLVSEDAENAPGLTEAAEGFRRAFAAIERFVAALADRVAGGAQPEAEAETPQPEAALPPEREAGTPPESEAGTPPGFDYDYLAAAGAGGLLPAEPGKLPENATLAQVLLTASVKPPVTGLVTSEFSYREHPLSGDGDFHTGMDIAAPGGTDVLAALPGAVEETGYSDIYGNYITLRHTGNLQTFYAHCSEILAEEGAVLRRGERIALVGDTGVATGPHLHFSVIVDGKYTDPYWILRDNIRPVSD